MKGSSTVGESTTSSGPSFLLALAGGRAVLLDRTTRPGVLVLGRRRVFALLGYLHLRLVTLIRGLLPFTLDLRGGAPCGKYELRLRASRTGCTRTGCCTLARMHSHRVCTRIVCTRTVCTRPDALAPGLYACSREDAKPAVPSGAKLAVDSPSERVMRTIWY